MIKRLLLLILLTLAVCAVVPPQKAYAEGGITSAAGTPIMDLTDWATHLWGRAKTAAQWAVEELKLTEISNLLVTVFEICVEKFDMFLDRLDAGMLMKLTTMRLQTIMAIEGAQKRADDAALNTRLRSILRLYSEKSPPINEMLCKQVLIGSMVVESGDYEIEVSRMAAEAISNKSRCPTCDGTGPDHIAKELKRRCDRKLAHPIEGLKKECTDTSGATGAMGSTHAGSFFDLLDGAQIFEMPGLRSSVITDPVSKKTLKVNVPEATTQKQEYWQDALDYLFWVSGPVPSPAHGQNMKKPMGKVQRAMFNHCLASQNALVKQCTDLLAFYTRPNCADTPALCESQNKYCKGALKTMDMTRYDSCEKGLAPYEEQKISHDFCKTKAYYTSQTVALAKQKDLIKKTIHLCESADKSWKEYREQRKKNCQNAVRAMQEMKSCWKAVEAAGGR